MSVFFTSRKTSLKCWLNTSSVPCCLSSFFSFFLLQSWQLLDTWLIDWEWFCILDSFSTLGGLIELLFLVLLGCSSTLPRYLNWTIFSTPPSTDISVPLDTCIYQDLLLALFKLPVRSKTYFTRFLSRYFYLFSPKMFSSHSNLCSLRFLHVFQEFLYLVSF